MKSVSKAMRLTEMQKVLGENARLKADNARLRAQLASCKVKLRIAGVEVPVDLSKVDWVDILDKHGWDKGAIEKVAAKLGCSPSTVSKKLRDLRDEIEVQLQRQRVFLRSNPTEWLVDDFREAAVKGAWKGINKLAALNKQRRCAHE